MDLDEKQEAHGPISDLFKANSRSVHGGLGYSHEYEPGFYQGLLDWVFEDERFVYWESGDKNFELRCSGTPGCGKVTPPPSPVPR